MGLVQAYAKEASSREKHLVCSFSLLECLVISERTDRTQKVGHTHSCCLPHSLLFVLHVPPVLGLPLPWEQGSVDCAVLHW